MLPFLWNYFKVASVIECFDSAREGRKRAAIRSSPEAAYQLTFGNI